MHFARLSSLVEGQQVRVNVVRDVANANSVCVEPLTSDDWEILELNAGYLEEQILSQVACCSVGQVFPLWIYEKALISLKVTAINGAPQAQGVSRLVPDTEVIVAPKQRASAAAASSSSKKNGESESPLPMDTRVIYPLGGETAKEEHNQVWLNPYDFARLFWSQGLLVCVTTTTTAVNSPLDAASTEEEKSQRVEPTARVVVRASQSDLVPRSHARLSWNTMIAMALRPFSAVHLSPSTGTPAASVSAIKLFVSPRCKDFQWAQWAASRDPAEVVSDGSAVLVDDGADGSVRLELYAKKRPTATSSSSSSTPAAHRPSGGVFQTLSNVADGIVSASHVVSSANTTTNNNNNRAIAASDGRTTEERLESRLESGSFVLVGELVKLGTGAVSVVVVARPFDQVPSLCLPEPRLSSLAAVDSLVDDMVQHVEWCLVAPKAAAYLPLRIGGFGPLAILGGGIGAGKSSVLGAVARCMADRLVYTEILDCLSMGLERISRVKSTLSHVFSRCVRNQPSLLVLESLHALCPAVEDGDDSSPLRPAQISAILSSLLRSSCAPLCSVAVVASAPSLESVHASLQELHLCGLKRVIPALGYEARVAMITLLAKRFQMPPPLPNTTTSWDDAIASAARLTDGFAAGDLVQFLHRCERVSVEMFTEARKHSIPHSVQGIKLHESSAHWSDIGGLESVKGVLKQTLLWPTKYGRFFKGSPIKLPSGILLYGHTGTGKTLLANAAASECGLNFISVSGPELLSKYIGASEQAVRDVFRRATAAKPSVIVFDEFDSLAPRRGHDSTGVTDRVVNQLLTQLDGVESRVGVYVIGVTSRPDLIDPALLRPGRLDKLLFVGIPNDGERLEILQAICAKMKDVLAPDLDLEELSGRCVNFTGADLSALMANAQLLAVHESLEDTVKKKKKVNDDDGKGKEELNSAGEQGPQQQPNCWMSKGSGGDVTVAERLDAQRAMAQLTRRLAAASSSSSVLLAGEEDRRVVEPRRVEMSHILRALAELKPSISEVDRRKFDAIYGNFQASHRDADFRAGKDEGDVRQTLM